ncbi:MAG: SDR family NAD(P)-dependent oxidoreductase [Syntrophaceae bacterium]
MAEVVWDYCGKVAIVTAATAGIGRAITERLVESGARVAAAARTAEDLDALSGELGEAVLAVQTDVTVAGDIERLVGRTVERFGRLDVAFNVAGGALPGTITGISDEDWDYTINWSLRSAFISIKHQARQMIAQGGGGAIVNISSINSTVPLPNAVAYSPAKAGVDMLTRTAAVELAEHRIRVNALVPGLVSTRATQMLDAMPEINAAFLERIPLRRAAGPREMTGPALFLGSDEASYITGATLVADGGWSQTGYPDLRKWF